jgi:hypothetical protein
LDHRRDRSNLCFDDDAPQLLSRDHGEYGRQFRIGQSQMALANLRKDSAIVGRHIQITALVQHIVVEARPFAVNLTARNWSPHVPHHVAMAVVCACVTILRDGPTEFGDNNDCCIAVNRSEAPGERRQPLCKRTEQISQLTFRAALTCESIPSADSQEAQLCTRESRRISVPSRAASLTNAYEDGAPLFAAVISGSTCSNAATTSLRAAR